MDFKTTTRSLYSLEDERWVGPEGAVVLEMRAGPEGAVVLKMRAGPEGAVVLKKVPFLPRQCRFVQDSAVLPKKGGRVWDRL